LHWHFGVSLLNHNLNKLQNPRTIITSKSSRNSKTFDDNPQGLDDINGKIDHNPNHAKTTTQISLPSWALRASWLNFLHWMPNNCLFWICIGWLSISQQSIKEWQLIQPRLGMEGSVRQSAEEKTAIKLRINWNKAKKGLRC
jgi:hypothetical protein